MKWCLMVVLWFGTATARSHLTVQNGGYDNLVVAISDSIPDSQCIVLLENLKILLTSASEVLHRATHHKFLIRSVDVVVPQDWSVDSCGNVSLHRATFQTLSEADVRVAGPHPVYGEFPWTLQVGGCGVQGEYISMGAGFVRESNLTNHLNGRLFVKEWLKYRYGVFEETGYPGDPLYPAFTENESGNEIPTSCSDRPLEGSTVESPGDSTVRRFVVEPERTGPVSSSLLALSALDNVTQLCDVSSHDKMAPTKQNALCNWQSVWEVIQLSPDFPRAGGSHPSLLAHEEIQPVIRVVWPRGQRIVFLIDRSVTMTQHDRLTFVRRAMLEFFKAVPEGTKVGIIMYAESAEPALAMTVVTNGNRNSFEDELDRSASIVDKRDLLDAVHKGLQMVQDEAEGSDVILVTSDKNRPESLEAIQNALTRSKVRVSVVNYPQNTFPGLKDIVARTGGRVFHVNERLANEQGRIENMIQLMDAFYSIINGNLASGIKVYERVDVESLIQAHAEHDVTGEFTLDGSLGRTTFTVYYYYGQTGLYDARRIRLTSPSGTVYTNIETSMGTKVVRINNPQAGKWSYSFTSTAPYPQVTVVQVRGHMVAESVTARAWTNWDDYQITDPLERPLFLYGEVKKGLHPIIGANVVATVEFLGRQGAERETGTIEVVHLTDDGHGGADIQQGDGIYSAHFTQFATVPGQYKVTLSVTDVPEVTAVVMSVSQDLGPAHSVLTPYCCGSRLPPSVPTLSVSHLQRIVSGPTITVASAPLPGSDLFPPSRVFDLMSEVPGVDQVDHFDLTWTAPGGDYASGRATVYDVRYSENKLALIEDISGAAALRRLPEPQYAGLLERLQVDVDKEGLERGRTYYMTVRAGDGVHWSKPSNIARVKLPSVPTTTSTTTLGPFVGRGSDSSRSASSQVRDKESGLNFLEIGGIAAGLTLFLLILAGFIAYYALYSSRKRKLAENRKEIKIVPPAGKSDALRRQPDGSEYRQHLGLERAESLLNQSVAGVYDGHVSPVQSWPASVLLTEHERRKSYTSLQNGPSADPTRSHFPPDNTSVHSYHNPQYMFGPHYNMGYRVQQLPPVPGPKPRNLLAPEEGNPNGLETHSLRGSSNPSDSGLSLSSDNLQRLREDDKPKKIPPPVLPKPNMALLHTPRLRDSVNSSEYDRRVRNITQV